MIDPLHHWTGIRQPAWRMRDFHARTAGLQVLIEAHYRYYQFYANCLIAILFAAAMHWLTAGFRPWELLPVSFLVLLFFAGSRDTLSKYYRQVEGMLKAA
ncbi:hypothetical protein SH668x_000136 [Planctomicrobium sp. SH668]|uniref:hypothetical protein n=1 Tax=Planctomicrobium sp. SH668 TaxID=3448126 RepID=UPI003F5C1BCD